MHQPVLLKEVLKYLEPGPGKNFIDCTIGFGGQAIPIAKKISPHGKLLGIDLDKEALEKIRFQVSSFKFQENIILEQGNFADLKEIVQQNNFSPVDGILFDLGMSSWQIEKSGRGFSFLRDEPLDMRFHYTPKRELRMTSDWMTPERASHRQAFACHPLTAAQIINHWPEKELMQIFKEYGEERYAGRIAQKICQARRIKPIKTTGQLVEIIKKAVPAQYRYGRIHFATRTFQALRIAVNDELNNLKKALPQALEILEPGGRLVVISFHSLEDRIVKNFFQEQVKLNRLKILTKKPIRPSPEEIRANPRSRSAKLRAAHKT